MNKNITLILILLNFILFIVCSCENKTSKRVLLEQELYQEKVEEFFDALKNNDATVVKSLFSQNAIENGEELEKNINNLIDFYSSDENEFLFVSLISENFIEDYKKRASVESFFPIINNGIYYWVYFNYTYIDEFDSKNIGINQINFYTSYEYYIFYHSGNKLVNSIGLNLHIEQELEDEIVCINNYPQLYKTTGNILNFDKIKDYLKYNKDMNSFISSFGEYNCKDALIDELDNYYYEILYNNKIVYLKLSCENNQIIEASLYNDREFIKKVI